MRVVMLWDDRRRASSVGGGREKRWSSGKKIKL